MLYRRDVILAVDKGVQYQVSAAAINLYESCEGLTEIRVWIAAGLTEIRVWIAAGLTTKSL